jgi:hypothetical protein
VRGEGEAVALGVHLEESEIVLDGLGGEGEHRGGEAAGEEVAALGCEGADGEAGGFGVRRERLETVIDRLVGEPVESGGGVGCHRGSCTSRRTIRNAQCPMSIACFGCRCLTTWCTVTIVAVPGHEAGRAVG